MKNWTEEEEVVPVGNHDKTLGVSGKILVASGAAWLASVRGDQKLPHVR